jgi:hypothetical protein
VLAPKEDSYESRYFPKNSRQQSTVGQGKLPNVDSHRGLGRWRVCKDKQRNLGDPYFPAKEAVFVMQELKPQASGKGGVEVGVSDSSGEASNDRGAKRWQ